MHHYTTIDVLALILKNKNIRFNRLDKVDDLEEGNTISANINLSKYIFVSCWTKSSEESIPLWKLYANGKNGVRISFKNRFFKEYEIKGGHRRHQHAHDRDIFTSHLPFDDIRCYNYQFMPPLQSDHFFKRDIKYVDNFKEKIVDVVTQYEDITMISYDAIAQYKHTRWRFQEECRFVVGITPAPIDMDLSSEEYDKISHKYILQNKELDFDDYYLLLSDNALDDLIITLCPSSDISQEIIVRSLLNEYAPKAKLKISSMKGSVSLK